jgi:hypothetical protein
MSALLKARQSSYSSQVNSLKGSPWHFNKGRSTIPPNRGTVLFNNPSPLVSSCLLFFPCVIRSPHLSYGGDDVQPAHTRGMDATHHDGHPETDLRHGEADDGG